MSTGGEDAGRTAGGRAIGGDLSAMETGMGNPSHLTFTLGSTMDEPRTMGPLVVAPADSAPAVGGAVVDTAFWPPSSSRAVSASPPPRTTIDTPSMPAVSVSVFRRRSPSTVYMC